MHPAASSAAAQKSCDIGKVEFFRIVRILSYFILRYFKHITVCSSRFFTGSSTHASTSTLSSNTDKL